MKNISESDEHCFFSCLNIMLYRILKTLNTANAKTFSLPIPDGKFPLGTQLYWQQAAICSKVRTLSKGFLDTVCSFFILQASRLRLSNRSSHVELMSSCVFSPSFHSAAAQHLRMQNERASETVAMVIVTRLIVTRILIKAHTATRLLEKPSR